jgi:MFS family permease
MKTFLAKIYSYCFFDDLVFIYPLYAVMFVDYGLTGLQISIILMVWSGTAFLLEVPSGVIADKYSRKTILFLAQVARIIGYAIWLFFPNFWGFLIGFVLWGIKSAFTSGTFEALLYDELKQNGAEVQYTKILGRQKAIKFVALTLAGLGATIGIALGYKLIIAISLISLAISAFSILSLPSAKKLESTHEKDYFKLLKEGLHTAIRTPIILEIIIFVSLAQALFGALDEYWSIFANDVGLPKAGLGIFFIVYGAVQAFASWYAYKFENQSRKFFYSLFLLNGIILFTAAHF